MNKTTLKISKEFELPLAAVTERMGWLGMSGGGKTFAAMKLAEELLRIGAQVVAVDPAGPWWGLRAGADGKSPGFSIHVFGGQNGDLPLVHTAGALVADVIVDRGISAVLDVSEFTLGQMHQFVADFAERFFEKKKRSPSPMHLFLEEAHAFIPQQLPPNERGDKAAVMLHRVDRIVRVGRNYGIGTSIISQQPQSVAKRCLNQIGTLFTFRTGGKHERKAIVDWFSDKTSDDTDALFDELKKLPTGTARVSSPNAFKFEGTIHVLPKTTFDSSRTPQFGEVLQKPKVLAKVDKDAIREAMDEVVAQAEKDDPGALRREIAELKRQLAAKPAVAPAPPPPPQKAPEKVEVPVLPDRASRALEALEKRLQGMAETLERTKEIAQGAVNRFAAAPRPSPAPTSRPAPMRVDRAAFLRPEKGVTRPRGVDGEGPRIKAGARLMLRVLAGSSDGSMSRTELGVHSVMSTSSGTFSDYLSALRSGGYVADLPDGRFEITSAGHDLAKAFGGASLRGANDLMVAWFGTGRIKAGARAMLTAAVARGPQTGISREQLGEEVEMSTSSGTFSDYLSALNSAGLIEKNGHLIRASNALFLYGS
jgi:uncharacterized protein